MIYAAPMRLDHLPAAADVFADVGIERAALVRELAEFKWHKLYY